MLKPYINWYNPKKRKPILQLRILKVLARQGELTKKESEDYFEKQTKISGQSSRPHYKEISDAYRALLEKKLITQEGSLNKGTPYSLTEKGLEVLITESNSEKESWSVVIDYSVSMRKKFDYTLYSQFNRILGYIMDKFVPYRSIGAYSYILQIFNVMSRRLKVELKEDNTVRDLLLGFTTKMVMTITEIASKTEMDNSTIKGILEMLSFDTTSYSNHYTLTGGDDIDPETDRWRYIDFLQHCMIFCYNKDGSRHYELSLFGILFLIKLLIAELRNPRGNKILLEKLDTLAALYKTKLPLIFGKWALIKKSLNSLCTYVFESALTNNEEKLFNKEQLASIGFTVMGYDNELIKNVYPMYVSNNIEREKILDAGMKSIYEIRQNNLSKYNVSAQNDIVEINHVIDSWERYCAFMRRFLNIEASMDDIFESMRMQDKRKSASIGLHVFQHSGDYPVPLRLLEKALEDEVTVIFFLNLMDASVNPYLYYSVTDYQKEESSIKETPTIERIKSILKNDDEIRSFLNSFMNDAMLYHKKEIGNISDSFNSFKLDINKPN
jgi:uncharacterized protein YjhX (UPF0386 family)